MRHTDLITWVSNFAWKMLLSEFNHAVKMSPCPRTTICNKCAKSNTSGDILNTGDNADDKENFGLSESYFKNAPIHLDTCKNNFLNLQLENMRPKKKYKTLTTFLMKHTKGMNQTTTIMMK